MEKSRDDMMDVDTDGASDNIDMGTSTSPNETSKKIELSKFPEKNLKKALEEILIYLDDKSLLRASHVSKLFASVAEAAFARKYAQKCYCIDHRFDYTTKPFDKVMLNKYGDKMRQIEIIQGDEEILDLVEQKCCNVKSLLLANLPRIVMLKDLREVRFINMHNLERETIANFIDTNPQLETLELNFVDIDLVDMLDGRLNSLKVLRYQRGAFDSFEISPQIRLNSLETLDLNLRFICHVTRVLQSMNCNNQIKVLILKHCDFISGADADDDIYNEISNFKSLVSLDLRLSHVTFDRIVSIVSMLPKLSKLTFECGRPDFDRFAHELGKLAKDVHTHFAKRNIEILLRNRYWDMIFITTDYAVSYREDYVELHWMDNLNEKNVREVLNSRDSFEILNFVNYCADRTFDISALAGKHTEWLYFASNGPISVESNFSHYKTLFPCLKALSIHLEQHSANDFLKNLEANFCEQIKTLQLNTKSDAEDPDMTDILSKFANLESLHLAPTSIKYDARRLLSVCPKLAEID